MKTELRINLVVGARACLVIEITDVFEKPFALKIQF